MQTSRKEFGEPQQFAGHSMQVRKQEMGKLLSHEMENARVDNCSQSFTDKIRNCGSTIVIKKWHKVV